jgi:acyl transferase domain-containing protein/acyl carrier protein
MKTTNNTDMTNAIAIIGMAGRFPGAVTLQEFWSNLSQGKETITFYTDQELLDAGMDPARLTNPNFVRAAGVYKNPLAFDARFFGYTPRDAELIDPQQRVFLECCWEALEMAGHDPARFPGRIGVFAGTGVTHYMFEILFRPQFRNVTGFNMVTSNDKDYVATRVGYKLDLRGPCVTVQTACSTSLVATVLGCQSLLTYQADLILAGGSTINPTERGGYEYMEGSIFSPDGHCRSFDADAKGTLFSSGTGVVVLRRLEDAIENRDQIYAVIRGFGLNNDGGLRAGFTAPGVDGQAAVTTEALVTSRIDPETVTYVECHGTATALGDPIEVKALAQAFGAFTSKKGYCAIGSVKSNIGHTDSAAGVAGLIKTVLALKHRQIPPSLHYNKPNPEIHFEETPFFVNTSLREWKSDGPLRAGINSFGIGGTNAHVILEEAPEAAPVSASRPWQLLCWSTRTPTALDALSDRLKTYLTEDEDQTLPDVAFTLQTGRRYFEHRRCLVCTDREHAIQILANPGNSGPFTFHPSAPAPQIVFLFPGQGAQYVNMAKALYDTEATFRKAFDECADLFRGPLGQDLRTLVYPEEDKASAAALMQQTSLTQPVLFATEYALAMLWSEWGIRPAAMLGHSIGEYVAACIAGVMTLRDAISLVAARGRLMQGLPHGSMLSIMLGENEVEPMISGLDGVCLAAVNGPSACVVSGPTEKLEALAQSLTARGVPNRHLKTSHAFHSSMMDPILGTFLQQVRAIRLSLPQIPYLSNLTGRWIQPEEATNPEYWVKHLRQAVRFSAGISELLSRGQRLVFLEVGPGRTLSTLVTQQVGKDSNVTVISSLPAVTQENANALEAVLKALGHLWGIGVEPDWKGFYAREERRKVSTVTYPFEREKYGSVGSAAQAGAAQTAKPAKPERRAFEDWFFGVNWTRTPGITTARAQQQGNYLVLGEPAVAKRITAELAARGLNSIAVSAGRSFYAGPDGDFTINPAAEGDYQALITSLVENERIPTHIVHALGISQEHSEDGIAHVDSVLDRTFYSPLYLLKAVGRRLQGKPVTINFVLCGAFDVVGTEQICPAQAAVFGPATSAYKELKNLVTRTIDMETSADLLSPEGLSFLVDEITCPGADLAVAFRAGHRWQRGYGPTGLPVENRKASLRENGTYLITGGLGGIGLAAAQWLAREYKAKLVLIGRSPLPEREMWETHLAQASAHDAVAEKIRGILELEESGAEVLIGSVDVADEQQMKVFLAAALQRFVRIDGVIHAAGIASEGIIELKQKESAAAILSPKIHGCLVLDKLLEDQDLDFFVLCASLTGILGSAGQVDYSAGNAFMDAFAWSKRRARKNRPVSIDWDRWDDVGMAAKQIREIAAREAHVIDGQSEDISHPVFSRKIVGKEHETYVLSVAAKSHWVVGEHKIMGRPTMVGTSHLEHVRAAYETSDKTAAAEIRDLIFIQPVMLQENEERDVYYTLKPMRTGSREFIVWSVENKVRLEHARGRIGPAVVSSRSWNADEIFSRCGNSRPPVFAEGVSTNGDPAPVQVSRRWDIFERIADSDREAIAEIRLSPAHLEDMQSYLMHPAVLDCATSYASGPVFRNMYLPLAYQRLSVSRAMSPVLYSYKRFKPSDSPNPEVISCDIVLFGQSGEPIVEIEGFTVKRVPDPEALLARSNPASNGHKKALADPSSATERFGRRMSPEEGVSVLKKIIMGVYRSQVIVNVGEGEPAVTIDQITTAQSIEEGQKNVEGTGQTYARPNLATAYVAPRSELESGIAEIWQSVLGIDKIGIHDDFIDLGGHSLLAIQLASRVSETFSIEFSVSEFYQNATVEGLAQAIMIKLTEGMEGNSLEQLLAESPDSAAGSMAAGS